MTDPKQAYLRSLVLERGLSANTATAYGIDIDHLLSFARRRDLNSATSLRSICIS